jgi:hypothetical protein
MMAGLGYRLDKAPMEGVLGDFPGPVDLIEVDETKGERLRDDPLRRYRHLGFDGVIGSWTKRLVTLGRKVVGAISFRSAACKLGPRDLFVDRERRAGTRYESANRIRLGRGSGASGARSRATGSPSGSS